MALPVYIIAGIILYVGAYHLFFTWKVREKLEHTYFALICFAISSYTVFCGRLYEATSFDQGMWAQRGQFSSGALVAAFFIFFIRQKLGTKFPRWIWGVATLWVVFAAGVWVDSPWLLTVQNTAPKTVDFWGITFQYLEVEPGIIINAVYISLLLVILYVFLLLVKLARNDKKRIHTGFIIAMLLFMSGSVHDILVGAGLLNNMYWLEYAYLGVVVLTDYVLLNQFLHIWKREERLNVELEARVKERMVQVDLLTKDLKLKNWELKQINDRLTDLTERDSLTGLFNHAAFLKRLDAYLNLAKRQQLSVGVGMVDIDHFKQINDTYGHQAGDQVLAKLAELLEHGINLEGGLRNYDVVSRYGGDEFAIILFCDKDGARLILTRLCQAMRQMRFHEHPDLHVTLSIGMSFVHAGARVPPVKETLEAADAALYQSKKSGRNQFTLVEVGVVTEKPE